MKKYIIFILIAFVTSNCSERQNEEAKKGSKVTNDTIPETRKVVSNTPVASYLISIDNPALEYKFGVSIFETPYTFKYFMRMQYEGMIETDTLKVPNFGIWPTIEVKPDKEKMSCIIGFLDKDKKFKEYKKLSVKNGELTLSVLKRYGVGVYSTKVKE